MSEDSCADRAGPHPEARCQLAGHLGVAGQMFPQTALVNIEFSTHRTRMVCTAPLC